MKFQKITKVSNNLHQYSSDNITIEIDKEIFLKNTYSISSRKAKTYW